MSTLGEPLFAAARQSRLVIFAGAGISMAPPTNLPSWRDFNRIVIRALAEVSAPIVTENLANSAAELILARHAHEKLPPEYQAQVLAEFLHESYFDVIRYLDSDRPNATHFTIAWLARVGYVRAILTTNFDRVFETAFAALGVPLERHYQPEHFRILANDLRRFEAPKGACQLLKLHGSVDDPTTLIDTLAQRKRGFAFPVLECARYLVRYGHWLFLGFSGLDLEAEPNYLGLAQESDRAAGFTWLVREKTEPTPAVVRLKERYGSRGEIMHGDLSSFVLDFTSAMPTDVRQWIDNYIKQQVVPSASSTTSALEEGAKVWAADLAPPLCAMALAFVVHACAEPHAAVKVVEAVLRTIDERWPLAPTERSLSMKSMAANGLGILLEALGRHEEAVRWLTQAVDLAHQAGEEDTRDRWRGNLARSLERLGRIDEARNIYQAVLAGYRARGDPVMIAFGLESLASFLIRQLDLDEALAFAEEAIQYAKKAGDERVRGTALNDLGIIAKLKQDYNVALELFQEVENLFSRLGNDEAVAAAAGNRGEILTALGEFDKAAGTFETVLNINERLGRRDNEASTYLSLGLLGRERGDLAAAQSWFSKAVELYRALKDPSNEAFALYRLASLKANEERFGDAIEMAQTALPLVIGRNAAFTEDLWELIGRANLKLGFVIRAEEAYREALVLARELKATKAEAGISQNLGLALLLQQRDGEAATAFAQAAELHQTLGDSDNYDYCKLCEAAVRLDERLAKLSEEGHAFPDLERQREAAHEMVAVYPDLIAMYEKIGATQLVGAFCESAANTANFAGELARAVEWYRKAAEIFQGIGLPAKAADMLTRCESLLQKWVNALMRQEQMARAIPLLMQLAEVSGQLGHRESCATAMLNAAIGVTQTSQDYAHARALAEQASGLFAANSEDWAIARKVIAFCDQKLDQS